MRFLSFKILAFCILLPPVLYIAAALIVEHQLRNRYTTEIEEIYLGDLRPIMDGTTRLTDTVNRNIDRYLQTRAGIKLGLEVDVSVATRKGKILYPAAFEQDDHSALISDPAEVAAENFSNMNDGIVFDVETKFEHNRLLSNTVLAGSILLSLLILFLHFRAAATRASLADHDKSLEIERLQKMEKEHAGRLAELTQERQNLRSEIKDLEAIMEDEMAKAGRNEDDLIEEIETLEKKLAQNISLQDAREQEMQALEEKLRGHQKGRPYGEKQKKKASDTVMKRFSALYKNLSIHDRAVSGFLELNDEMKLKAEEVIHQLDSDPGLVKIKRKVFGKKGQETVLEVLFGYKGRLYFRNTREKRPEVLAIGTKNTQARELQFLSKL